MVKTPPKINLSFPSDHEDISILPKLRLTFQLGCLDVLVVELFVFFDSWNVLVGVDDMKVFGEFVHFAYELSHCIDFQYLDLVNHQV